MEIRDPETGEVTVIDATPSVPIEGAGGDVTGSPIGGTRPISDEELRGLEDPFRIPTTGGVIPPNSKALADKIDKKLEDKNPEAVKADLSAEAANPAVGGEPGIVADRSNEKTVERADGTVTTNLRPDLTAHYIGGNRVMITEAQKAQHDALLEELNKELDGRAFNDIPLGDKYFETRKEFDSFVARLKR